MENLSITDLIAMDPNEVELKVFKKISEENKFFQIKLIELNEEDEHTTMMQFIDITKTVQCNQIKQQNEFLNLINATVSHEMRNPLNSISA